MPIGLCVVFIMLHRTGRSSNIIAIRAFLLFFLANILAFLSVFLEHSHGQQPPYALADA